MSRFDTGVLLSPVHPPAATVELGRRAEALGYDQVWVADEGLATRDVFVTMGAIATATARLRIGTGIVNPFNRHPALTAAAVATVDELSGGRAFLAMGAGGSLALAPLGITREHPLARVREAMAVCRRLFDGDTVTFHGDTVRLAGARLAHTRPGIEIWFAGRSPKLLAHAGAAADGVLLEFLHVPSLGTYADHVRAGAAAAGRPMPKWYFSTCLVTEPDRLDHIRPHMTYRLVDSPAPVRAQLGITDHHVAEIREAMQSGLHEAAPLVPDRWITPFVVTGSPDDCAAQLRRLRAQHGFAGFVLVLADLDRAANEMEAGAEVVRRVNRADR